MRFKDFFMEYKLGLKKIGSLIPWKELPFYRKVFIFLLIVFFCVFAIFSLLKERIISSECFFNVSIGLVIIFLVLMVIFFAIDLNEKNCRNMLENQYKPTSKKRVTMLVNLLENYGINIDTDDAFDRIDLLIQQAEESKINENPLKPFKKALKIIRVIIGACIVPPILYVVNKIADQLSIQNLVALIIYYVTVLAILFVLVFALVFVLQPVIMMIIYPDCKKYDELIYDLKQLKIFPYIDSTTNDNQ